MFQAIGWTLLHSLWQIALVFVGYKAISWLFFRQNQFLYRLSIAAMLAMLLWSVQTFRTEFVQMRVQEKEEALLAHFEDLPVPNQDNTVIPVPVAVPSASRFEQCQQAISPYVPLLGGIWCLGALLLGFRLLGGYIIVLRLKKRGVSQAPEFLTALSEKWRKILKIGSSVRVLLSDRIAEPMTIGFWKPVVLFPAAMLPELDPSALELLLLHELAHIRRFDYIVNIGQLILETLFFYHPLFWMLSKEARARREYACDDVVKKYGTNPLLYARTLTNLQLSFLNHQTQFAMHATGNGRFTARIMRIMGVSPKRAVRLNWIIVFILPLMGLFIVQSTLLKANTNENTEKSETLLSVPEPANPAQISLLSTQGMLQDSIVFTLEPLFFKVGEESEIRLQVTGRQYSELVVRLESAADGSIKSNGNGSYTIVFKNEGYAKIYVYRKEAGREFYIGKHQVRVVNERIVEGAPVLETIAPTPGLAVETVKMNVLYVGVDNPLNISVAGYGCDELSATINAEGATLTALGNCQYVANLKQPGDVTMEIYSKRAGAAQLIGKRYFRVKRIPDPVVRLGNANFRGGVMTKEALLEAGGVLALLESFDFDASCQIVRYEVNVLPYRQDVVTFTNHGGPFEKTLKDLISKLSGDGDAIFFDEVMVECPGDAAPRNVGSISVKLKPKTDK